MLLSWGRDSGTYAGETVLTIVRKLAQLGVNVIVGYGPNAVQDHAYFGSTLVIFSMGNLLSFEPDTPYCWSKVKAHLISVLLCACTKVFSLSF